MVGKITRETTLLTNRGSFLSVSECILNFDKKKPAKSQHEWAVAVCLLFSCHVAQRTQIDMEEDGRREENEALHKGELSSISICVMLMANLSSIYLVLMMKACTVVYQLVH